MDPRNAPTDRDGPSSNASAPPSRLRRRLSMEEDFFYQQVMTTPRRPSQPPPYEFDPPILSVSPHGNGTSGNGKEVVVDGGGRRSSSVFDEDEELPEYSSSIALEGVFSKKHEIENTTKRAEDRQWHTVFVTLNGTALNLHRAKKDWGWGKTRDGPSISPDNPPWIKKSTLEKTYSLLHADTGIAADYKK